MEESEFLQWITRIQTAIDEQDSASTSNTNKNSSVDDNDDATQDLIAAFRWVHEIRVGICGQQ